MTVPAALILVALFLLLSAYLGVARSVKIFCFLAFLALAYYLSDLFLFSGRLGVAVALLIGAGVYYHRVQKRSI